MKFIIAFVATISLFFGLTLPELRNDFEKASKSSANTSAFYDKLEDYSGNNQTILAYKGASKIMKAKIIKNKETKKKDLSQTFIGLKYLFTHEDKVGDEPTFKRRNEIILNSLSKAIDGIEQLLNWSNELLKVIDNYQKDIASRRGKNVVKNSNTDKFEEGLTKLFEKDNNNNITMVKSNVLAINEIISDVAVKIQEDIDNRGRENIEIAIRQFYWV